MTSPPASVTNAAPPTVARTASAADAPKVKTRLLIHKIRSTNFKSFCGTRVIGPFNTHFTAIIGPNGSGKSNTLDMIQFIFSKKASSLRAKKLPELIYNSGGIRKDFCKVEIVFWVVPVDFSDNYATQKTDDVVEEFTIGRSIRNKAKATSSYYINGRKSTSEQVVTLLKKYDVDLENNRFLILQGEVESIATKNNLELMDYLEEVIGSDQYKLPIEELKKKLEEHREIAATKNIEAINIENSLKKARTSFEGGLKSAHDRLQVEHCKKEVALLNIQHSATHEKDNKRAIEVLGESLNVVLQKIARGTKAIEENEKILQDERKEIEEMRNEYESYAKKESTLRNNIQESTQTIDHKRKRIKKYQKTVETSDEQIEALQRDIVSSEQKMVKLTEKIDNATNHLETAENSLQQKYRELQRKLKPIQEQIKNVKQKLSPFNSQKIDLSSKLGEEQKNLAEFEEKHNALTKDQQQIRDSITSIKKELDNNMIQFQRLDASMQHDSTEDNNINAQINDLRPSLQSAKQEYKSADDNCQRLQREFNAVKTGNRVFQAVEKQNFLGFHDRVGNLAAIDPRYNTAINSVLHHSHSLVVDNTSTFKRIVRFLKENQLGRSNFENLEMVTRDYGSLCNSPFQAPQDAPRLFDLLTIQDPQYRPLFYKALRNTLVARDVTRARDLAFNTHRVKVVTLSGEVVNPSGGMTSSGSTRHNALGASVSRVTKDDINQAQGRLDQAAQRLHHLQAQMQQLEGQRNEIANKHRDLITEHEKAKRHIDQNKNSLRQRERHLQSVEQELQNYTPQSRTKIVSTIESLEARLQRLDGESTALNDQLKMLQQEEKILKGRDCTVLEEKIRTLKKEMECLQKDRSKSRQKKKSASQKVERIRKDTKDAEKNISSLTTEIESLEKKIQQFKDKAEANKDRADELTLLLEEKAEELKQHEEIHENNQKKLEKMKVKQDAGLKEVKKLKSENVELQSKQAQLKRDLKEHARNLSEILAPIPNYYNPFGSQYLDKYKDDTDFSTVQKTFASLKEYFSAPVAEQPKEEQKTEVNMDDQMQDIDEDTDHPDRMEDVETRGEANPIPINENISIEPPKDDIDDDSWDKQVKKLQRSIREFTESLRNNPFKEPANMTQFVSKKKSAMQKRDAANKSTKLREKCAEEYTDLCEKRKALFNEGFAVCDKRMRQIFRSFTEEGDAALSLLDPQNPFENGVLFNVRPPGKSWREIQNLSGGEKTLSSLALVFGLHHYRPTPIYIMDEIDAALDFKNVSVIGNYIKEQATNAQFIVISLRNHMFDLADRLVGIYKTHDITKTMVIEPGRVEPDHNEDNKRPKKKRRLSDDIVM
mmetsp:Transcript_9235/g.34157  ORF Transcript_9235/g.34157 Transcript_9235/m.34157 type:complete len:1338 (-) Transcript_9235:935-4948(-)|eukprot:CAMPEP_0117440468 /NCGR_PEP_ID=MMETSP0759-20121206/3114_1 /TAXON_ID=63605 /ORGANISM="Percolomonas cosmopolitus, Strain WS" /LENGTH=1337 /DNA_ID=CAMNT_0005232251 /DNA_START=282 /DNA_END=4295 /DNA_ORIENTATION=+